MTKIIAKPAQTPPDGSVGVDPIGTIPGIERLYTITSAAELLGIHDWQLRRAVKRGDIPSYTPFNSRKLVRLSEVEAAINASKIGGRNA